MPWGRILDISSEREREGARERAERAERAREREGVRERAREWKERE